jgi:hypothetical protein
VPSSRVTVEIEAARWFEHPLNLSNPEGHAYEIAEKLNRKWMGIDITYQSISLVLRRLEDSFGVSALEKIRTDGIPKDMESAVALAHKDDEPVTFFGALGRAPAGIDLGERRSVILVGADWADFHRGLPSELRNGQSIDRPWEQGIWRVPSAGALADAEQADQAADGTSRLRGGALRAALRFSAGLTLFPRAL